MKRAMAYVNKKRCQILGGFGCIVHRTQHGCDEILHRECRNERKEKRNVENRALNCFCQSYSIEPDRWRGGLLSLFKRFGLCSFVRVLVRMVTDTYLIFAFFGDFEEKFDDLKFWRFKTVFWSKFDDFGIKFSKIESWKPLLKMWNRALKTLSPKP